MLRSLLSILTLGCLLYSCQNQVKSEKFTINGKVEGLQDSVLLFAYYSNGMPQSDTVQVTNGTFQITGTITEPTQAWLHGMRPPFQVLFYLENVDYNLSGHIDSLKQLVIAGSEIQNLNKTFQDKIEANRTEAHNAYQKLKEAQTSNDLALVDKEQAKFNDLRANEDGIRSIFIKTHPNSILSINELVYFIKESNFSKCKALYESLATEIKQTKKAEEFLQRMVAIERTAIGQPAIDFTQNDVNGKPVSLSSYKGKYVLLDFWASWCGPCRFESPHLVKAYKDYKSKGFEILAVSLDKDANKWKKAIEDDGLNYVHVSDLNYWKNAVAKEYGIRAVPSNFLINPEGIIIAKNLKGKDLSKKLAKYLQ